MIAIASNVSSPNQPSAISVDAVMPICFVMLSADATCVEASRPEILQSPK